MADKARITQRLIIHPAFAKAAGKVRAPVPTIKLKTYIKPICKDRM